MKALILQRALAYYFSKKGYLVCREVSLDTEERRYWGDGYKVESVKTVRADFIAMKNDGHTVIVETKSGMPDFRSDKKWSLYRPFCEQFYFCADEKTAPKILEELKAQGDKETGVLCAKIYGEFPIYVNRFGFCHIGLKVLRSARNHEREREILPTLWLMAARNSGFYLGTRVHSIWNDDELLEMEYNESDIF